ncbi:hypothetical protein [Xenorhabdus indica]|uniref:hypothetical protein n=1 Tax=Xenorhabdus indica TaxID=333964 RepID=UPI001FECB16D|nr:hypothetical protein [Xenorhabdus indica]MBC8947170.1 hypothetical protein [Xenorhabdus indica]
MKHCQRSPAFSEIKREIRKYARNMNKWWGKLQHYTIAEWSLLIGIGCWGVPNKVAQIISFTLSLMFFFDKLFSIGYKYSFVKMEKNIKDKIIKLYLSDNERDILFKKLDNVRRFRSIWNSCYVFKRNWKFIFGGAFLGGSFVYHFFKLNC